MKKFISEVIGQDYINWNKGDLILLKGGTGAGKTTFIKKKLNEYCLENNKKILYLTNRNILKKQIKRDLADANSNITVMNYQKIETLLLNYVKLDNFDYIICDEAHYFFTDSSFNRKTDLFFKKLMNDTYACRILMTATPISLENYLKDHNITINYTYTMKKDYSYIANITAFTNELSIESIIEDIPQNEQIMFFGKAKKALELAQKYNGTFICSEHNQDDYYKKYVEGTENEKELENIIENSCFNNHLLCTTTALDNGINIKENTPVRHIILDILDRDTFLQCLGRKRVAEGEKVNLYFNAYTNKRNIIGYRRNVINTLEKADYLLEHGQEAYVQHKFKTEKFSDGRIIDEIIDTNGNTIKVINECMYTKLKSNLVLYDSLLGKKYKFTFKNMIALQLDINDYEIDEFEVTKQKVSIEEILDNMAGVKLYKDLQKDLIEFIGLKDARGRLQKSISQLNAYLESNNMPYVIISKVIKENKKSNRIWVIDKLVINQ